MERVLGGVTAQGAAVEGPGVVRNFSDLPTLISVRWAGDLSERVQSELRRLWTVPVCRHRRHQIFVTGHLEEVFGKYCRQPHFGRR